jgi:hypothetical protein
MKNLAHSASFESLDKDAPSNAGTKHLGPANALPKQNGDQNKLARWVVVPRHVVDNFENGSVTPPENNLAAIRAAFEGLRRDLYRREWRRPWSGSVAGARVVLLDWDIQSLAQGGVAPRLTHMRERTTAWFHCLKPLRAVPHAHLEPAGNGYPSSRRRARKGSTLTIDAKYVSLGTGGRALAVEPHATQGRLKICRTALDKRMNYRGVVANHLVRQITGFRAFDKDASRREDDLFDAAMYAALTAIGMGLRRAGRNSSAGPPI